MNIIIFKQQRKQKVVNVYCIYLVISTEEFLQQYVITIVCFSFSNIQPAHVFSRRNLSAGLPEQVNFALAVLCILPFITRNHKWTNEDGGNRTARFLSRRGVQVIVFLLFIYGQRETAHINPKKRMFEMALSDKQPYLKSYFCYLSKQKALDREKVHLKN